MKKLHLLPTNNPSRIGYYTDSNDTQLYILSNGNVIGEYKLNWKPQHIYITSDEEIKEKDWFLDEVDNSIHNAHKDFSKFKSDVGSTRKKIILTTDQDLIKDDVQAIDNEFLEWFVKNSNCKEVEIKEHWAYYPLGLGKKLITCQVIIPNEKPTHLLSCCKSLEECHCGKSPKQETIEEAAKSDASKKYGIGYHPDIENAFIRGVNWQAETYQQFTLAMDDLKSARDGYLKGKEEYRLKEEKMYSESDIRNAIDFGAELGLNDNIGNSFEWTMKQNKWFEQFKKN